ncbi:headcase protein isoform X1 [Drosophila albomicans]|uniref:Headcase protein isoform X1 n=2 Tax=Drosophila albomicans TaxID=7291 RepID=A0A6P8ZFA2_DROAB|nr:headcase protein isoform X1 [Drosophila albomicans]
MAPRRNPQQQQKSDFTSAVTGSATNMAPMQQMLNVGVQLTRCCYPNGECGKLDALIALDEQGLSECVRVLCNNENCNVGQYMHRDCFDLWEAGVLQQLKSSGRARSWSERQRVQQLWTKKGYELVAKSCNCKCGRGQLRKDLDWLPHGGNNNNNSGNSGCFISEDDDKKKAKKKRNRNSNNNNNSGNNNNTNGGSGKSVVASVVGGNLTPNPNVGVIGSGLPHNNNNNNSNNNIGGNNNNNILQPSVVATLSNILMSSNNCNTNNNNINNHNNVLGLDLRNRAGSLSSSGSSSPSASQSSADISLSPVQQQQQQQQHQQQQLHLQQQQLQLPATINNNNSFPSLLLQHNGLNLAKSILPQQQQQQQQQPQQLPQLPALANISNFKPLASYDQQQLLQQQKNKEVELYSERVRSTSGCNGIFSRRLDFSSFNLLPKTRLNSYQVKIEDEGNHGNDETRLFILSSLAQSQMSRVACILCEEPLLVFDRYPLVDGSFFLSPKQHSSGCIEVKYEGRMLYLTCVCMSCLDGTSSSRVISCRFCSEPWDGSSLVLGTMYAYDIFAAMPCCADRFKCNNCFKMLMHPQKRLSFYSDYSHGVTCPYCNTQDTHFVKPLNFCYTKSNATRLQAIA